MNAVKTQIIKIGNSRGIRIPKLLMDQVGLGDEVEMVVKRFDVYLVSLDPTVGSEIKKTRPCLIISPDEMNHYIATVIVAPMTAQGRPYPTRVACRFQGTHGQIVLDQLR